MRNAPMKFQTKQNSAAIRELTNLNKMSQEQIENQTNVVANINNTYNIKRMNKPTNKMNGRYIKKQTSVVANTNQINSEEDNDLSHYYKPSRSYDESSDFKLPSAFLSKNGKFDTSKKYWGLKDQKWQSNRSYDHVGSGKKTSGYNKKGKVQGDHIKHNPRILPKQVFKKREELKQIAESYRENKFWQDEYESEEDEEYTNNTKCFYLQFLKDDLKPRTEIEEDKEFNDIIRELDDIEHEMEINEEDVITPVQLDISTPTVEELPEVFPTLDGVTMDQLIAMLGDSEDEDILAAMLGRPRSTQGLSIALSYLGEAITALSSTVGLYYGYQIFSNVSTVVNSMDATTIVSLLKDYVLDLIYILTVFGKYYYGSLTITDASCMLLGYFSVKSLLNGSVAKVLDIFTQLVPAQSNSRHTQGADMTTFAQGVISIIGAFFLGDAVWNFNAKTVMAAVKTLGSTLLTVKTFESVIIAIIQMLPDIVMSIICEVFPTIGMYINVTTNTEFKSFMDDTIKMYNMGYLRILYNSHYLTQFLSRYSYLKERILIDDHLSRGIAGVLHKFIKWYDQTYIFADKLGLLPGKRHMPYVLWLCGEPGIGKSTLAKHLATTFARGYMKATVDADIPDEVLNEYVYSHSTSNKYFDGYNNQPVFILNDYLQFTTEQEEQWLIKFVDTIDLPLEVSSVDNKEQGIKGEVRFTSKVIIITSNSNYLSSSKNITDVDAFNRRRDLVVKLVFKENRIVDLDTFDYSWIDFHLIPNLVRNVGGPAIAVFDKMEAFLEHLTLRYNRFLIQSGMVLDATKCNFNTSHKLMEIVDDYYMIKNHWKEFLLEAYAKCKDALKTVLFKIKNYVFNVEHLMMICTVGGAGYMGYKAYCASLAKDKITQSMSGDVSTHKYREDRKPLNRYTMGISDNIQDLCVVAQRNMCEITTIIPTEDGRMITQTMWGVFVGGSLMVTPKHLWKRGNSSVKNGDKIIISSKGQKYHITYSDSDIYFDPDRDIACLNTCGKLPNLKSIEHLLMDETTKVYNEDNNGFLIIPVGETIVTHNINAYIRNAPYIDNFGGRYDGKEIWQYNIKTMQGDCGSIMVLSSGGKVTICGLHVAGDSYTGNSEILDKLFVNEAKNFFTRKTQGFATDAILEDEEFFDAVSDLDEGFIFLGKTINAPFQSVKTSIVRSPFYEVLQPHTSEPAVMQPSDPRMDGITSPMLTSIKKYGDYVAPFDEELLNKAFNIVKTFYDPMRLNKFTVDSHTDAINSKNTPFLEKLDISTSAGYPWSVMRKNKKSLIDNNNGVLSIKEELQNKLNTCENLLDKKTMFPYTLTTTLKDERVSLAKVKIGKTRTFMNFPVEYTILMRKYFDSFIDAETQYAREIGTTVGVNIYSSNWDSLYVELSKFDYHLDGDYKAFDGTIRPEFFRYYTRLVNSMYNDAYYNHRTLLVNGCCFAPIFVLDKVYMKLKGNPSGSRITTSFNSFTNRMYVVMSILNKIPSVYHTPEFFKTNMKMYAHGDDHLIGFSQLLQRYWDGLALEEFMGKHHIGYTSSKKDQPLVPYCKLSECFYLKSHFVFNGKKIMCGLDKSVIQEMVSWQRDHSLTSTKMILQTALRYAYFWGFEYFQDIRKKLLDHCKVRKIQMDLPYFEDLENEYEYNGQMEFNYTKF